MGDINTKSKSFYLLLLVSLIFAHYGKQISSITNIPFEILGSVILIFTVLISCVYYQVAILGLGVGSISGFVMFSSNDISNYLNGYTGKSVYPEFITSLIPLSMVFSFCGLFILFHILRVSRALESLIVFIARFGLRGRKSAKFTAFILGMLFFTGGTTSSAAVSAVMKDIALKYITPEELAAIIDMTAAPVALIFQKFSYWGILLTSLLITPEVPILANEALAKEFLNKIVLSIFIFPNFLIIFCAFLLSIDKFPRILLSKRFKDLIDSKQEEVKKEGNQQIEISNKASKYNAFIVVATLVILVTFSAIYGFKNALLIAIIFSILSLAKVFYDSNKGAHRLTEAIEGGILEATPILVILFLAGIVATFLKMTGLPSYLASSVAGNIPYKWLPLIASGLTFTIAYASGTSFGTYKIMLAFIPALAYNVAISNGLSPEQTLTYLQIVIGGVLVTSVQADLSSFVSDTTIVSARGSGCSVINHFLTQMPIVAYIVVITLISYTFMAFSI